AAPSVHAGLDRIGADARDAPEVHPAHDRGRRAGARQPAGGLPLLEPLPARDGRLPLRGPAARALRRKPRRRLPSLAKDRSVSATAASTAAKVPAGAEPGFTRHAAAEQPLEPLLEVENLRTLFPVRAGVFLRKIGDVHAVDGVSFTLARGRTLGLVGESG